SNESRAGKWAQASADYNQVLVSLPHDQDALLAAARLELGPLHDLTRAEVHAKAAHQFRPTDPAAEAVLGQVLLAKHDFGWARTLLADARAKLPQDPTVAFDLARANYA